MIRAHDPVSISFAECERYATVGADIARHDQLATDSIGDQRLVEQHRFVGLLADSLAHRDGIPKRARVRQSSGSNVQCNGRAVTAFAISIPGPAPPVVGRF